MKLFFLLFALFDCLYSLQFGEDELFKIVQFADLHFGERAYWDEDTQSLMKSILEIEQPDLVVVTGDFISGEHWTGQDGWFQDHYDKFTKPMRDLGIQWALTLGHSDVMADLFRDEIMALEANQALSLTESRELNGETIFNYKLPLLDSSGQTLITNLWFIDTAIEGCREEKDDSCLGEEQLEWIVEEAERDGSVDYEGEAFFFMHVPLQEFLRLYNNGVFRGNYEEDVQCQKVNTGLLSWILAEGLGGWVIAGANHDNDFYGDFYGVTLSLGRKTGYAPESSLTKGARVYEIQQKKRKLKVDTWIRNEFGEEEKSKKRKAREIELQGECGSH